LSAAQNDIGDTMSAKQVDLLLVDCQVHSRETKRGFRKSESEDEYTTKPQK